MVVMLLLWLLSCKKMKPYKGLNPFVIFVMVFV